MDYTTTTSFNPHCVIATSTPLHLVQNTFPDPPSSASSNHTFEEIHSPDPITPPLIPALECLDDFIDPKVLMSPTVPARAPLLHSASYTYGTEQYPSTGIRKDLAGGGSVSSERSTVGLGQGNDQLQPQWPPKTSPDTSTSSAYGHPTSTTPSTMMLPPMRNEPPAGGQQYYYSNYSTPQSYGYPSYYHTAPLPQHPPAQAYRQPSPYMMPHQPHFGYGYPQPPHSASSHTTETYPPSAYTSGTIQPSAFGGWASENRQRESTSTISTGLAPDDYSERRRSVVSVEGESEKEDDAWEQHSPLESVSEYSDSVNSSGTVRKVQPKKKKKQVKRREEHREGNVTYTTDAEVKQTPELKRMCFNCEAKAPPSWRKSILNPGRILCNKCGIFERTHHRARPPQNDDQKLRKNGPPIVYYRREAPAPLIMRNGAESPLMSPYSSVPSQATPQSANFSFPAHYSHSSMPPPTSMTYYDGPSASTHSNAQFAHRRHSQAHVYAQQAGSPYASAYNRRTASQHTTPVLPTMKTVPSTAPPTGAMPMQYWNEHPRRYSDAVVHPLPVEVAPGHPVALPMDAHVEEVKEQDTSPV